MPGAVAEAPEAPPSSDVILPRWLRLPKPRPHPEIVVWHFAFNQIFPKLDENFTPETMKLTVTSRRVILPILAGLPLMFSFHPEVPESGKEKPSYTRPDILLFIADDMTWRDCEPYGNPDVKTPHLKKLAAEGICFDNMYTATAMCGPSRQSLYTGIQPVRNGSYPNHSRVYGDIVSIAHHFKDIGYRVALIGKQHYAPEASFPFEYLGGRNSDDGDGQDINLEDARNYLNKDKSKPYLLIVATNQPHSPWNRGNPDKYQAESLSVAPYMVDTEFTRKQLVSYYAEITYADSLVGYCMDMVEAYGNKDNTLFIFTSEQGHSLPFGKWTCYNTGLKTAFIVRWPKEIKPGTRTSVLAQYVDVLPTLYEASGEDSRQLWGDKKKQMLLDGTSFYNTLTGQETETRKYVYGIQTTRGINGGSANYPVRSIQNHEYKLIWNPNYQAPFYCSGSKPGSRMYEEWLDKTKDDPVRHEQILRYRLKPEFELYNIRKDPFELLNIDGTTEELTETRNLLLADLKNWMNSQGDEGIPTELKALTRFKGDTLKWYNQNIKGN
jgi:N-sulfoglucosamine sulfohydrolase